MTKTERIKIKDELLYDDDSCLDMFFENERTDNMNKTIKKMYKATRSEKLYKDNINNIWKNFVIENCEDRSEDILNLAEIHTEVRETLEQLIKLEYIEKVLNIEEMDFSLIRTVKGEICLNGIKLDRIGRNLRVKLII